MLCDLKDQWFSFQESLKLLTFACLGLGILLALIRILMTEGQGLDIASPQKDVSILTDGDRVQSLSLYSEV